MSELLDDDDDDDEGGLGGRRALGASSSPSVVTFATPQRTGRNGDATDALARWIEGASSVVGGMASNLLLRVPDARQVAHRDIARAALARAIPPPAPRQQAEQPQQPSPSVWRQTTQSSNHELGSTNVSTVGFDVVRFHQ